MRRLVGMVSAAALVFALGPIAAVSAVLSQTVTHFDLGSQLMLRVFGETSDSSASFAAARGDRASESPLRDLALAAGGESAKPYASAAVAAFEQDRIAMRELSQGPLSDFATPAAPAQAAAFLPALAPSDDAVTLLPPTAHFTAAYQPEPPLPAISPAPGTLAFAPPDTRTLDFVPQTVQLGAVQFEGHDQSAATAQTPHLNLGDASYGAGANFDVRAGKRNLNVNLSSEYEHLGRSGDDFTASTLDPSSWQVPGGAPLVVPNYADLNRLSLGAGVSVPVVRDLTLNLNYDAQRLYGGYGLPGLLNLDTMDNTYGGKLTFNIPRISSSLSISAYQDRLQDSLLPLNASSQTREDVNFTVKF